ncbi:Uncharacterised protein [Mycobacterium tuberculosis]|nr:Uncharacterised protein [Mycobacterium tuberculosis]CPB57637.1 Uncharacterised protein [Mycobacterium tuberculosis]
MTTVHTAMAALLSTPGAATCGVSPDSSVKNMLTITRT